MRLNQDGVNFLKQVEGVENMPYQDSAGYWTIGVGHLLTKRELKVLLPGMKVNGISDAQIDHYLKQDVKFAEDAVNENVRVRLYPDEFNVLVSFTFNLGAGAFKSSTLLRKLNSGLYEDVPAQLVRWNRAGGKVVQGLVNRRALECELWDHAKL